VDATVGGGGHSEAILEASGPDGRVIALDRDAAAIEEAQERLRGFGDRTVFKHASFSEIDAVWDELSPGPASGVLFDLGLSSLQLSDPERGFSLQYEGPLDMRFDQSGDLTAEDVVNTFSQRDLSDILRRYGEEPRADRVAHAIVERRPFRTTRQLADTVQRALGRSGRIHPATRTFQALRIAVNEELEQIPTGLEAATRVLTPSGRLVVLSYHSLEDRLVKQFFRNNPMDGIRLRILTPKPIRPTLEEVRRNARARSARLRAAERIGEDAAA
jgi:16S rRNA (cytosine1402-N4)-methyltransferase